MRALLFANLDWQEAAWPGIQLLMADPHPAVRVAAQGLCLPLLARDREQAVDLFLRSCDHPDDRVLIGIYSTHLLQQVWRRCSDKISSLIKRMAESMHDDVAEAGGFWSTAGFMMDGVFSEIATASMHGSTAQRKGVAKALAELLQDPEWSQRALPRILDLLHQPGEPIENEFFELMREQEVLRSPCGPVLAQELIECTSSPEAAINLLIGLQYLEGSLISYAPAIYGIVERLSGAAPQPHSAIDLYLPAVLLRLYEQLEGSELKADRSKCLDVWDRLLQERGSTWGLLKEIDS